ncbi:3-keto-5-aminohexanoate cleavage protein [Actinacidiphila acidipaludis]|uniref:3-keto-5-aminohexanoate cleavage protein n=1 Tax=Actinacidiphila acidipaludis TaxID=2873382 RepID=A0ABS7Q962_9ACTN|nr:3-keto-5-aminohexanoate cleavage protein [Streptomyces acidipaludis]MBY8879695.1 3-keto-5-aminohexanoate cleavage protein [Streptomyces acidipaludis]
MLQVCLNGARTRAEHAGLPVTPAELAAAARAAVAAGASDVHLHPKDRRGQDTLDADAVAAALTAVRAAVPGIPVGVTTGAWATPDPAARAAQVRSWTVLPDHASVNWHEDGAETVAATLLARGVGIEAGLFSGTSAAARFAAWPDAHRVVRVLAEVTDTHPRTALDAAAGLLAGLAPGTASPILLHGEDDAAWPVLRLAVARRLAVRIGLEDVLLLPDGSPAADNAGLVRAARQIVRRSASA